MSTCRWASQLHLPTLHGADQHAFHLLSPMLNFRCCSQSSPLPPHGAAMHAASGRLLLAADPGSGGGGVSTAGEGVRAENGGRDEEEAASPRTLAQAVAALERYTIDTEEGEPAAPRGNGVQAFRRGQLLCLHSAILAACTSLSAQGCLDHGGVCRAYCAVGGLRAASCGVQWRERRAHSRTTSHHLPSPCCATAAGLPEGAGVTDIFRETGDDDAPGSEPACALFVYEPAQVPSSTEAERALEDDPRAAHLDSASPLQLTHVVSLLPHRVRLRIGSAVP